MRLRVAKKVLYAPCSVRLCTFLRACRRHQRWERRLLAWPKRGWVAHTPEGANP